MTQPSSKRRIPLPALLFLLAVITAIFVNEATSENPTWFVLVILALLVAVGFWAEIVRFRRDEKQQQAAQKETDLMKKQVGEMHAAGVFEQSGLLPQNRISISSLPPLPPNFVGRGPELDLLDHAWANEKTNIVQFVAPGGTGKTTLVHWWLARRLPESEAAKPDRIYAWSFFSQGAGDNKQSSSDLFFLRAGVFFDQKDLPTDPRERGRALADALRRHRCLLILDGIEPLQHPPGPLEGELKDPALRALLKELAFQQPGLCLLTTRVAVKELEGQPAPGHVSKNLDDLGEEAGAELLKEIGVRGSEKDLRAAARDFKGHALALRLLGNYLTDLLGGDVRQRDRIPHLTDDERAGSHARRVMEAYVQWFSDGHTGGGVPPEVALLHLLGLFDRPAPVEALDALLAKPNIAGLTDGLRELDPIRLKKALNHIKKLGLLTENGLSGAALPKTLPHLPAFNHLESLDAHPLVREHFGQKLEAENPTAWREANTRLYLFYRNHPEKHLPDTLDEMEPLFLAMAHGCRAGRQQEVLEEVYWERIRRKGEAYSVNKIGAFGSDLTALAHLFERVWDKPSKNLNEDGQAFVLSCTGFGLRGTGRLREAVEPMKAGLERRIEQKDWNNAATNASNLSQIYLTIGTLPQAVDFGRQGVKYAEQSGSGFQKEVNRINLADILHQHGELAEAERLFAEAEAMQQKSQPEYRFLYSLAGYQYCDLLLGFGKWEEVLERVEKFFEWRQPADSLLNIALENLSCGSAHVLAAQEKPSQHLEAASKRLNQAVEGLRKAGTTHHLPKGLLARAAFHRSCARPAEAEADLQEAFEIAESGNMGLYLVDYHLEMARLRQSAGRAAEAASHKAEALRRIGETGYLRRLAEAEAI